MEPHLKTIARTGFAAKGVVYAITGILTLLAAFNMGGEKAGKLQVLQFLDKQPFGNFLIALMAAGIACYSVWRLIEAISDPEQEGSDSKGMLKRAGYFVSGVLYFGLAVTAVLLAIGSKAGNGSSGGAGNSSFLASKTGLVILGIVGVIIILAGFKQFRNAYKDKYLDQFGFNSITNPSRRKTIKTTAQLGLAARGVIFLILGYFALRASWHSNPSEVKTTRDVFSFIKESDYGGLLLGIVSAGLIAYALYMFLLARFRVFRG